MLALLASKTFELNVNDSQGLFPPSKFSGIRIIVLHRKKKTSYEGRRAEVRKWVVLSACKMYLYEVW